MHRDAFLKFILWTKSQALNHEGIPVPVACKASFSPVGVILHHVLFRLCLPLLSVTASGELQTQDQASVQLACALQGVSSQFWCKDG